jgi:hypothetical protein
VEHEDIHIAKAFLYHCSGAKEISPDIHPGTGCQVWPLELGLGAFWFPELTQNDGRLTLQCFGSLSFVLIHFQIHNTERLFLQYSESLNCVLILFWFPDLIQIVERLIFQYSEILNCVLIHFLNAESLTL